MRLNDKVFLQLIEEVYFLLQSDKTEEAISKIESWALLNTQEITLECFIPLLNLGMQLARSSMYIPASIVFERAALVNPSSLAVHYNLGLAHALLGNHVLAITHYDCALRIDPYDVDTLINKAASQNDMGKYQEGLAIADELIALGNVSDKVWMIRGVALSGMAQWEKALNAFDQVLAVNFCSVEAYVRRALILTEMNKIQEAILAYERALIFDPRCVEALSNLSSLYLTIRQHNRSLSACDAALGINKNFANAWINRGFTLAEMNLHEKALEGYDKAIAIDANLSSAWIGKGFSHSAIKQFESAVTAFERALEIDPEIEFLLGPLMHSKMHICDWESYDQLIDRLVVSLKKRIKVSPPFQIIGLIEDLKLLQTAARDWVLDQYPIISEYPRLNSDAKPPERIKLGYFSADFREHPVSQLVAGLIEAHDRKRFEVYAFSWGPKALDGMRKRLEKGFDHFIEIEALSDQEVVEFARKEGINIAIDLTGLTGNSRPGIFAGRAAPIQVNYLGFPSTMGASFMDYLIADETLIPASCQDFYDEKVLYMPYSFQVNDASKVISDKDMTRSEFGLPDEGFVFCAFSNGFKITPIVFVGWMNILRAIPKSVLWLAIENEVARDNLRKQANTQGVCSNRLIFADRLPLLADHLARYRLADLFLDTAPYGAHTTASDALWAGLPVLTCVGSGYASRVAASLLHALDLDGLISESLKEYERKAISLAQNPEQLKSIKVKLQEQAKLSPLFDTSRFAQDLEKIYLCIFDKYQASLV